MSELDTRMIVCAGEVLVDMIPFETETGVAFKPAIGGSPYNTAIAAARLEAPTGFLGSISGDFFGRQIRDRLVANHGSTMFVIDCSAPTTLAVVGTKPGSAPEYMFYTQGTSAALIDEAKLSTLHTSLAAAGCVLFGSISLILEPVGSVLERLALRLARLPDGPLISVDPNVRSVMVHDKAAYLAQLESLFASADIVKLSDEDCGYLYPDLHFEAALLRILEQGPRLVAGTNGSRGSVAFLQKADGTIMRAESAALQVQVVDTIGAGDTFHGALLAWLSSHALLDRKKLAGLSEQELKTCLAFASCAAGLVCTRSGAEPPFLEELTPYLSQ